MNNRNLAILLLFVSAMALLVLNILHQPPAVAQQAITGRDYSIVTAPISTGGDALYILDNRSQRLGVFTYDPTTRQVRPRVVRSLVEVGRSR